MRRLLALLLVLPMVASGCIADGGAPTGRVVEAVFPEAVALYEQSRVKVMGFDVGIVEDIEVQPDQVVVRMRVDDEVPLPTDVEASIVAFTLIGERNIVLPPAWQPGMERAEGDLAIPSARTTVPVEVDEALDAFVELSEAIDPEVVDRLLANAAEAVAGRGSDFNDTLDHVADAVTTIDALDQDVLALASDVSALARTLTEREQQVVELLRGVGDVADVLDRHTDDAEQLLVSLDRLDREGSALLEGYTEQLPRDAQRLADLAAVLEANTGNVQDLVAALLDLGVELQGAYDEDRQRLRLRTNTDELVGPLLEELGRSGGGGS